MQGVVLTADLAQELGLVQETIVRWVRRGHFKGAFRQAGRWCIPTEEAEACVELRRAGGAELFPGPEEAWAPSRAKPPLEIPPDLEPRDLPVPPDSSVDQLAGRMLALFEGFQEERRTVGAVAIAPPEARPVIYGICNDGSVWVTEWTGDSDPSHIRSWKRCPPIPGTRQAIEDLRSKRQRELDLAQPSKLDGEG